MEFGVFPISGSLTASRAVSRSATSPSSSLSMATISNPIDGRNPNLKSDGVRSSIFLLIVRLEAPIQSTTAPQHEIRLMIDDESKILVRSKHQPDRSLQSSRKIPFFGASD
ncbi:hypothetical protein ACLOJK_018440 [Asimina triloba]